MRDDAEAEDIVQETYVRAFTHLDSFRGESAFATWLARIALNEAFGRLRRKRATVEFSEPELAEQTGGGEVIMFPLTPTQASPEFETGREQVRHFLEHAIDRLPEPFRLVFILRDVEGYSTEGTASLLSLRPETMKTRLFRARRLMRAEIAKALSPNLSELFLFGGKRCSDGRPDYRAVTRTLTGCRPETRSEYQGQNPDHDEQTNQEDDADGSADELEHLRFLRLVIVSRQGRRTPALSDAHGQRTSIVGPRSRRPPVAGVAAVDGDPPAR